MNLDQMWRDKRTAVKRKKMDEAADERKRKGILTGREIFMQVSVEGGRDPGVGGAVSVEKGVRDPGF